MNRFVNVVIAVGVMACPPSLLAQRRQSSPPINACSLVPKAEVKKNLPWIAAFDGLPVKEEAVGPSGSSCKYPSVFIQVLTFSRGTIDQARKQGGVEPISGIGDEAYFHNNSDRYAEVYVKVGERLVTLQANLHENLGTVKPGVVNLAKVFAAKLR
jgi:hypothetical protein